VCWLDHDWSKSVIKFIGRTRPLFSKRHLIVMANTCVRWKFDSVFDRRQRWFGPLVLSHSHNVPLWGIERKHGNGTDFQKSYASAPELARAITRFFLPNIRTKLKIIGICADESFPRSIIENGRILGLIESLLRST